MIAVLGATGTLGQLTVRRLLETGESVVAGTRDVARASGLAADGAEVREVDLVEPGSLLRFCAGVTSLMTAAHGMLGRGDYRSERVDEVGHRALINAARVAGIGHIVYISARGAALDHPVDFWRTKYRIERYLERSGMEYTILRPSAFMETHVHDLIGAPILARGRVTILGRGDTPVNFVAADDVARVATAALLGVTARNVTVEVGGPGATTRNQIAELYRSLTDGEADVAHLPGWLVHGVAACIGPFHPGFARALRAAIQIERSETAYDPEPLQNLMPVTATGVDEFVRARVARRITGQTPQDRPGD